MARRRAEPPLPYSKVMSPDDFEKLAEVLYLVDNCDALHGQHPIRRWEYAMAVRTIQSWQSQRPLPGGQRAGDPPGTPQPPPPLVICDIGGAGSNFWKVLGQLTPVPILIIDPAGTGDGLGPGSQVCLSSVETYAAAMPHGQFDIVTCISVVEHVPEIRPFFRAIRMLLKTDGLLFLTTDFWDKDGPDTAHFHWMRKRIYNEESIRRLLEHLRELRFKSFGVAEWAYRGDQVHDYSVASAAMVAK